MAGSGPRKPVVPMVFPSQIARQGPGSDSASPMGRAGLQVTVSRAKGSQPPRVFVFTQARVIVGRSSGCDLRLEDPERVSSSRHAEIRIQGDRAQIVDLGSRNYTFLNGSRLEPQQPADLGPDDRVAISDSELQVQVVEEVPDAEDQRTMSTTTPSNPLAGDAGRLAEALDRLAESFDGEPAAHREAVLAAALDEALGAGRSALAAEILRALQESSSDG